MLILGVADGADGGAALIDGSSVVAVELQARHDRKPAERRFPWASIEEVLEAGKVRGADIEQVALAGRFSPPYLLRRFPGLKNISGIDAFSPIMDAMVSYQAVLQTSGLGALQEDVASSWMERRLEERGIGPANVELIDVHRALAAAAYATQEMERALILTAHPRGDGVGLCVFRAQCGQIQQLSKQGGLSLLHTHIARVMASLSLESGRDEERLWSEAALGTPDEGLLEQLRRSLPLFEASGPALLRARRSGQRKLLYHSLNDFDLQVASASVVAHLTESIVGWIQAQVERQSESNLILAGSVFDNPRVVAAVAGALHIDHLWVYPGAARPSLALGAAAVCAGLGPNGCEVPGFGRTADSQRCDRAITAARVKRAEVEDPVSAAIDCLAEGGIVGRFQGRGGFGRRGNGNRSVLCRADRPTAMERAQTLLRRPAGEPLGCLVPEEYSGLLQPPCTDHLGLVTFSALESTSEFRDRYGDLVGGDRRVLARRVRKSVEPQLHAMLTQLAERTGCEVVACLPLGDQGGPSAALPGDAVRVWKRAQLNGLLLGPYWLAQSDVNNV